MMFKFGFSLGVQRVNKNAIAARIFSITRDANYTLVVGGFSIKVSIVSRDHGSVTVPISPLASIYLSHCEETER